MFFFSNDLRCLEKIESTFLKSGNQNRNLHCQITDSTNPLTDKLFLSMQMQFNKLNFSVKSSRKNKLNNTTKLNRPTLRNLHPYFEQKLQCLVIDLEIF